MTKPKAPKRPKAGSSLQVWENYEKKLKDHQKKLSEITASAKKKKQIQDRTRK